MDVVFTSLEALILKATQEYLQTPDKAALDAFCTIMKDSPDGPALAAKALAARVQGGNVKESLLALVALDRCIQRCDANFLTEIGKFRFLNELIKLVSPKYYADRTPPEVQERVLQLLHTWSIEYPKESKFKVAFEMLRSQGVVRQTPPPLPPDHGAEPSPRPRAAAFEDDEKSRLLQKLLRSKNPDDLQSANKLIKTMVREEERRAEAAGLRALEVRQGVESARLLASMLARAASADADERQLMSELEAACRRHHSQLATIAARTTGDAHALDEILKASDELTEVFIEYQAVMSSDSRVNGDSLLDLAGLNLGQAARETTARPAGSNLDRGARESTARPDVLSDMFCCENGAGGVELLKPVSLISPETESSSMGSQSSIPGAGLSTLDSLGAELLQRSLPGGRLGEGFAGKSTKKIPMNALETVAAPAPLPPLCNALDLDFLVQKTKEAIRRDPPTRPSATTDDLILDISLDPSGENARNAENGRVDPEIDTEERAKEPNAQREEKESEKKKLEVRSLADIEISLSSIQAGADPPLTLLDDPDGLQVVIHAAINRPRPDVRVFCLSATSRHRAAVTDYKFHAVVPKCCKVRLLPASGSCLPPHSPFLQPAAILQLMLVARPPDVAVALKFVVTYCCNDETVTEMGEAELTDA